MFKKIATYLKNVRIELSKVSWPTRAQLIESTSITLVLAFMIALYIFIADNVISRIVGVII